MKKHQIKEKLYQAGVVAVIRADNKETALNITKACIKGGITAVEITFTVPEADEVIKTLSNNQDVYNVLLGAGTVLNAETATKAINAGAQFIVSPGFDLNTLKVCEAHDIAYIPGCLTITEMLHVIDLGVEVIKLFPGSAFGPDYVKAIKGPLPNINIMPTGGVSLLNVKTWIKNGVVAVGVGSELTGPAKTGDFEGVTQNAKAFIKAVNEAKIK
jgi:2-dehydro-3-deoxyphosphogluconate aldolase / (4S)-4-hydroxy-2-oxoglutarate aldolase